LAYKFKKVIIMIKSHLKLAGIAFTMLMPFSAYASYSISPVKLTVTENAKITSLTVRNESDQTKTFQLTVYEVVKKNGKDEFVESKDIKATPVIFKASAGKAQLVRVSVKNTEDKNDKNYKLSIKEINPKLPKAEGSVVNIIPEFQIPVQVDAAKGENAPAA